MRAQSEHLPQVAQLPNVRLRVLPFRTGGHPCITGPFNIVSFAETGAVDVVPVDAIASAVWVENPAESGTYSDFFDRTARLKDPDGPKLRLSPTAWAEFTAARGLDGRRNGSARSFE